MPPTAERGGECQNCPRDLRDGERTAVMAMRHLKRIARKGGEVKMKLTESGEWIVKFTVNCTKVKPNN